MNNMAAGGNICSSLDEGGGDGDGVSTITCEPGRAVQVDPIKPRVESDYGISA